MGKYLKTYLRPKIPSYHPTQNDGLAGMCRFLFEECTVCPNSALTGRPTLLSKLGTR